MLSAKSIARLSFIFSTVCWFGLLIVDLIIILSSINQVGSGISPEIPRLILVLFFIALFVHFRYSIEKAESMNFIDLLWRVFIAGLLTTLVTLGIAFFFFTFRDSQLSNNSLVINSFYHVNLGLISTFLISTFIVWKRLILYQKSKKLLAFWRVFEYSLLASLVFSLLPFTIFDTVFNIVLGALVAMGLLLSANLKWIAYLNFKQKWKSILLLLLVLIYLWHFLSTLFNASSEYSLATDLMNNVFILALFAFIFIYALFSLLVLLFNLPTSSVFEQKLEEIINFQRLSQSMQTEQKEDKVYDILLESSLNAVLADAAWLEVNDKKMNNHLLLRSNIEEEKVRQLQATTEGQGKVRKLLHGGLDKLRGTAQRLNLQLNGTPYRSVMVVPLVIQNEEVGSMVLLKEVDDGFNKEMTTIINNFANQACISIENFRLMHEALENERYKEELKIARDVQRSLLPKDLDQACCWEIAAFSQSAAEVGGDYYDIVPVNEYKYALIIGDVSGKGTSAAFHMSQLKGVFHSLVQLDLSAREFIIYANRAISRFLEKKSFITASLFLIDTQQQGIEHVRAGHSPSFYYSAQKQKGYFLKSKGLGLGILRNSEFDKFVETNRLQYLPDDLMVLYTDGITEAKNTQGEEFGFERMQNCIEANAHRKPEEIQKALFDELFAFCGNNPLGDDYTTLVIKFKA